MSSSNNESVDHQSGSRRAEMVNLPTSYATYVDRWAIVVGVSKYKHDHLNLKYADRDAEALYELLLTPSGGGFEKDHIVKLVNEEATTANITRALRSFLKKPAKEDIVLIYFACHGAPDIDRPGIVYLLTHDVDPRDISGTALPMREIDLSLKENLLAERVIILADTCHSAAIGGGIGTRDVGDNSAVVNSYLQEVSKTRGGLALLTSAEANEVSFEDAKWGGGHGVFTHYLLEGMRGAADCSPKNGVVTVGELFEYVRENVQRATDNKQHPCVGTNSYDRNLPVAITAGISAQEHYELGCQLYQIGLKLDDKYCFESASWHLREAIRQAAVVRGKLPEAHLQLGLALTASGNLPDEAVTAFKKAIKASVPDADYYLGIAYLNQGGVEVARQHLEAFLSKQPDSDKADAVRELILWLDVSNPSNSAPVNRYALLVGINYSNRIDDQSIRFPNGGQLHPLKGCVNDIEILNEVLSQKFNFKVKMLSDMEASYENIIDSIRELQDLTSPRDVVIVYYGGHTDGDNWIAADIKLNDEGDPCNVISSKEIYSLIDAIPALRKHLIMDAVVGREFEGFINRVNRTKICTLSLCAAPGQFSFEVFIPETEKSHGYFTYTLVQELWQASGEILQRHFFDKVIKSVQSKFSNRKVTPFFLGDPDKPLFFAQLDLNRCPDLFTFSQCRCYFTFDSSSLQGLHQKVRKQFTTVFPDFYYSLGLAFLEKDNNEDALVALETSVQYAKHDSEEKLFSLGLAQFNNRLYDKASQTFQQCLKLTSQEAQSKLLHQIISTVDELNQYKRYALLVGIDNYLDREQIQPLNDAVSDTLALKAVLVEKLGFQTGHIKVLLNQEATYNNILSAFTELVNVAQSSPTLFYFAGLGSINIQDDFTILAFDSRCQGTPDIALTELAQLINQSQTDLVSIIDSNWAIGGTRYIKKEEAIYPSTRAASIKAIKNERNDYLSKIFRIGSVSLYSDSIKYLKASKSHDPRFTNTLIRFFCNTQEAQLPTYQTFKNFCDKERIYFDCDANVLEQKIFSNAVLKSKAQAFFIKLQNEPTRHAVLILRRLIEQRNGAAPEELFNLGIAYYRLNEYDKSIAALQTAIDKVLGQNTTTEGQAMSQQSYPKAHYWLGRVLYETKRDPARAVSELRLATQQNSDSSATHYYLGKALRALVEQEILTEAERAFQTYLNAGAPLGQQQEVQEFLRSRKASKTS
ncbi:caspase family protein [Leptolyngbya sp. ST-U4]|uniref:caspase family protein n=1 Tax=Leptolyngbya sp. ST-U4 TaxID=2933912 RepID=UPI003296E6EF